MRAQLLILLLLGLLISSWGHEFWLSPQKYFFSIRETAHISFKVGENFNGENWKGNQKKVSHIWHYTPAKQMYELSTKLTDAVGDSLLLPLAEPGTHMITFQSNNSFIELPANSFNDYLKEDGLSEIAAYRSAHQQSSEPGKEYYQRSVKTIIQVGEEPTNTCSIPTGLPLDIIPQKNPYELPEGLTKKDLIKVKFKVLFKEKPLQNALVKVWFRLPGKPVQKLEYLTDKGGWITTERHPGIFMVSCVHMEQHTADAVATWQSYWGSVTFEYSQVFPGSPSY